MKIVYVIHTTDPAAGATKSILAVINGLAAQGDEAIVVAPDAKGIVDELRAKGILVIVRGYRSAVYPRLKSFKDILLYLPRLVYRRILNHVSTNAVVHSLENRSINIIHSNSSVIDIGYNISRRLHVPHVYHIREYADLIGYRFYPNKHSFVKRLSAESSFAIFITKGLQSYFGQSDNPNAFVIYNAIYIDKSTSASNLPHKQFFLYAGRIEKTKGLDILLPAYEIYQRTVATPLPLFLVGAMSDTAYVEELNHYIQSQHMQSSVRLLGEVNNASELMTHAIATVIPSLNEGFGRCMPESMLCHTLTIARNATGSKEQMDNGLALQGSEIALRFETIEDLAHRLSEVSQASLSTFDAMCDLAYDTVSKLYSLETNINQTLMLYKQILNN